MIKENISNISIISSLGKNNELGKDNKLIWHFKEDMKFFKEKTMYKPIIMGYNTFLSLPKILPGRRHIVLTSKNIQIPKVEIYNNIDKLLEFIKKYKEEVMIIGGEKIYQEFISYSSKMYLTEIEDECLEADAFFPEVDDTWIKEEIDNHKENNIVYKHLVYTKKY